MNNIKALLIGLAAGLLFSVLALAVSANRYLILQDRAIKADVAYYHPKTGEFIFQGE